MMGEKGYVLPMADIFWKAVAAFAFIGLMTALRFGLSWGYDTLDQHFAAGLVVGGMGVCAFIVLIDRLERKGWLD